MKKNLLLVSLFLSIGNLCMAQTGNVGIGTAAPTQKLDVNGEARVRVLPKQNGNPLSADSAGVLGVNCYQMVVGQYDTMRVGSPVCVSDGETSYGKPVAEAIYTGFGMITAIPLGAYQVFKVVDSKAKKIEVILSTVLIDSSSTYATNDLVIQLYNYVLGSGVGAQLATDTISLQADPFVNSNIVTWTFDIPVVVSNYYCFKLSTINSTPIIQMVLDSTQNQSDAFLDIAGTVDSSRFNKNCFIGYSHYSQGGFAILPRIIDEFNSENFVFSAHQAKGANAYNYSTSSYKQYENYNLIGKALEAGMPGDTICVETLWPRASRTELLEAGRVYFFDGNGLRERGPYDATSVGTAVEPHIILFGTTQKRN